MTSWEPNRLAQELTTVVDAAAASLWLEPEKKLSDAAMLERGFARVFGRKGAREAAAVTLACDRFPFSGYPRWEINSRWDVIRPDEPSAAFRKEEKFFAKLAGRAKKTPAALRASVDLRHYLAARDVYVRAGGKKPPLEKALRAARSMWTSTRDARVAGPNEEILRADRLRLREPRSHGWQLCYHVRNFAPAAQLVAVEQQRADRSWETLQACHTIEFQACAARPRGGLTRAHAAPVAWDGNAKEFPQLRFALRGLGEVMLENVSLRRGRVEVKVRLARKRLGQPAPTAGFPDLDWTKNRDELPIQFSRRAGSKIRAARTRSRAPLTARD